MNWILQNIISTIFIVVCVFMGLFVIYLLASLITKAILKAKEDFHEQRKCKESKSTTQPRDKG
jgi:hypothetical protein